RRNDRNHVPVDDARQREIEADEGVRALETAQRKDAAARADHVRRVRRIARELEGEVRLDGCVQLGGPAKVNVPAAIAQLTFSNPVGELRDPIRAAEYREIKDVVRLEGRVGAELA